MAYGDGRNSLTMWLMSSLFAQVPFPRTCCTGNLVLKVPPSEDGIGLLPTLSSLLNIPKPSAVLDLGRIEDWRKEQCVPKA